MAKCRSCFPVRWPTQIQKNVKSKKVWKYRNKHEYLRLAHCTVRQTFFFTKGVTPRCWTLHVEVVGFVTAAALGSMGEVFIRVSVRLIFRLALVMRSIGAGNVQLGFRGGCISCRCEGWRFIVVCSSLQVWCI